jgi:predicted esterase
MQSHFSGSRLQRWLGAWAFAIALSLACGAAAIAASITLRDGTVVRGQVEQEGSFVRVDDGLRRILFGTKRLSRVEPNEPQPAFRPFQIKQPLAGRSPTERIDNLVAIEEITEFDGFGRRTFSVRDPVRGRLDLAQGITEINPEFVRVQSLRYLWESCIATHSIPAQTIEAILRNHIDPQNVDERFRLTRFFLETEWFVQAGNELDAIAREFPEVVEQVEEAKKILEQLKARRRVRELRLRRAAGQHGFVYRQLREFATEGAPGDVLTEVRDLVQQYEQMIEQTQQIQQAMDRLYREVKDSELQAKFGIPLREISEQLHVENLPRLDNFLAAIGKEDLSPEDRLALAVSGWLVGSAGAEPKADRALRLWEARGKLMEYVREPSQERRQRHVSELRAQELVSVELAAHLIEHLPPLIAGELIEPGKPARITVRDTGGRSVAYWVSLPAEYNPYHAYPLIITLHGQFRTPEDQITWWSSAPAFQASRHGYIVMAPVYLDDPNQGYRYDTPAHDTVLHCLIDARRRFSVDSDRVFLTGHSLGGHAAWDIGLAHPDLFAGVIPICGSPQYYCEHYWPNAEHTAFYVIEGEKNGKGPEVNQRVLERMITLGHDVLYVEFQGRGHEGFSDEQLRLFEWMGRKSRRKFPLEFSCRSARPSDNEFYWVSVDDFVEGVMMDPRVYDRKKIRTAELEGKITGTANSIQLSLRGPKQAQLWLSPGMLDLSQPITVRVNGKIEHRKVVPLDLEVLLEDFRIRADRQKLFFAKMSFSRL